MKTKTVLMGFLFGWFVLTGYAQDSIKMDKRFPERIGYVNDFEGIFTLEQIKTLEELIVKQEKETTNEIAVVTITSYAPYPTLFDYSLALGNDWGIGKKDKNNGIVIVMGKQIRQIRIQVGYGLENKLKDEEAKRIVDQLMIPEFKKGEYYAGLEKGLTEIIREIK